MLFRTVYGPELAAIYHYIMTAPAPQPRTVIQTEFLPKLATEPVSTQGVDDALAFLESTQLITERRGQYQAVSASPPEPFVLVLLHQLRRLELGELSPVHPLDPLYLHILTELFILPDRLFVADVHTEANRLRAVTEAGGLSREKLQAWKRVLEYLGLGQRVGNGFRCALTPNLLLQLLTHWQVDSGTLQDFLEQHLSRYVPFQTVTGELATAVAAPLRYLAETGVIGLSTLQDSPSKPYFGEARLKHIARREVTYAD